MIPHKKYKTVTFPLIPDRKYILVAFPYPSGSLMHVGHVYNYAIMDSYCRWLRYKGYEVFQPFGYDSFGLPAENYAKKHNLDPKEVTYENIEKFRVQMDNMNTQYEELLITSDTTYQKWSQWIFTQLYNKGLAYKTYGNVNYCSSCETVLANEQVKDNKCERCNTDIEIKQEYQWYFKITDYAERLLNNLYKSDYPQSTIKQQKEWIGKSEGYEIDFGNDIIVFTTKPETIMDVEFIVTSSKNDKEEFTNQYCIHPISKNKIPIYTADYVIDGYGTGYVMGVPNDDKRDREFAIRHNIKFNENKNIIDNETINNIGKKKINYKIHDWCVSRQRKWGCPIPIDGETDTLDTFVDSSFYFIRYCDPNNFEKIAEFNKIKQPDLYVIGSEHSIQHLLFSRFINMFLYDIGITPFEEPFKKVIHQGMILNNGEKMSKSKGNVINPDNYNSDELRMYLMFIGHYFDGGSWSDENIIGIQRFKKRMNIWLSNKSDSGEDIDLTKLINTIDDFVKKFKFNKVVSTLMEFYNKHKNKTLNNNTADKLIEIFDAIVPGFII